ncbi:hypothetical protein AMAG_13981 [Allomyces macrogynus ATCC 38327]|uniref:SEC7 domain-containing protein n=1 Tax=Allomyces macrogynus (strain ATCC 38327) TaxID=578462 RepID=A0A0L0T3J0_ALLM3|nr:hypothetical protein AMAG_13981 [Allomyces macrogynus ATCC 38327]|eukprot:KNE69124.1 hypothetical protein AMAG_13981 [Allomyces macrogynus ATCC 38327]
MWWRMRQMRLHFSHILKRAGSGASIVTAQRPSGSRGGSGDDPLRRGTRHYVLLFNQDPREAVEAMRSGPLATYSPDEADDHLVEFLRRNALTLDKTRIGELFGLPDPPIQRLLHAYMASLPLDRLGLSDALRAALATFRLPGEAQKIDRVLDAWARAYCAANPGTYRDPTTAFVLAFSVIMLNTDAHNPAVKKKMTLAEFIRNNRGIDAGGNVPEATLRRLYYDIKCCAIRMQDRADPGEMAVVKAIAGMENSRSKLVAEFIAFKVIKGAKHERFVFLFKDVLVITKQKPGPKYLINHQWPIQTVTVYPASNASSDYDIPHSVYLGHEDEADDVSPMTAGTGGSAGSGSVGSTSDLSDRVHLAFSTPEEHEVFLKQLSVAKVEQSKQHEVLTDYLANRVARTKSTLESRYRSVSEDPAAAAPHLTRDPPSPQSRPSTPPTKQLFTARRLSTSPSHDTPPPLVVSPPPPPPPSSSTDDIDATTVPLPRSPTAPLSPIAASPADTASPPSPTDTSTPASPQLAAPPSVVGRAGSMRAARVALQRESAANAHAAHMSRAMVLARARSSSADVATTTGTPSRSRRGSTVAEENENPMPPPIVTDPVADLAPPAAMGTPPPQARARSPTLTSLAAWIRRASTIAPAAAVGPALPASPTLSDGGGATKSVGTIPMTASTSVSSGLVSPPPIEVTPAGSREDGALTGSGGADFSQALPRSPSANGVLKRIGSFVMPSRSKSIVPGPAVAGVVRAAQQQAAAAAVAGTLAASMPAIDMDGKGDGRTHPTTCPASDEAITVVAAAGADGLVPASVASGGGRSRSRSASTVCAGMMTQEGL